MKTWIANDQWTNASTPHLLLKVLYLLIHLLTFNIACIYQAYAKLCSSQTPIQSRVKTPGNIFRKGKPEKQDTCHLWNGGDVIPLSLRSRDNILWKGRQLGAVDFFLSVS